MFKKKNKNNKNKKAFTLIELLAIIVILAIIAVITVPIILNIIENSKRGAVRDSAYGYKDSIHKYYISKTINGVFNEALSNEFIKEVSEFDDMDINGIRPSDGWVKINKGQVVDYSLKFDDYVVNYDVNTNNPIVIKNGDLKENPDLVLPCPGSSCYYEVISAKKGEELPTLTEHNQTFEYTNNEYVPMHYMSYQKYPIVLAHTLDSNNKIDRSFVCLAKWGYKCLEGAREKSFKANKKIIKEFIPNCDLSSGRCSFTENRDYYSIDFDETYIKITKNGSYCEVNSLGNSSCVYY